MKAAIIRRTRADKVFDVLNVIFMVLILLIALYPLYFVLIASVSDAYAVAKGQVFLWPNGFTWESYMNVFKEPRVWTGYRNTIFYTVVGTTFSLFLTIPSAYGLSKKSLPGKHLLSIYFLIPMYFSGGLIPTYLVMKDLNLVNQWYSMILIAASSVYNMIVTRVYFQSNVPEELYESARIDGANELKTFFAIALPLVTPIIAVMTLFFAVSRWNDYFNSLIYVTKNDYLPLQMVLRSILLNSQTALQKVDTSSMDVDAIKNAARLAYMAEAMKYALIVVSSAPLLVAYPFVQKHFVKGMMVGAVKG
ncbi:MAG: carbohydrate ABC transporter permease [Eubacteriales bacterium]|nr:carbohydrate ABC transporter permease [Eubacteriales bacterium]